jgi:hypothetical protein
MATQTQKKERSNTLLKLLGKVSEWNLPLTQSQVSADIDWLHRQESTLHRLAEKQCNDESWGVKDEKKRDAIEARVRTMLELYHIPVQFNNDPRGGSIRMILGGNVSNNLDNETWGIYW